MASISVSSVNHVCSPHPSPLPSVSEAVHYGSPVHIDALVRAKIPHRISLAPLHEISVKMKEHAFVILDVVAASDGVPRVLRVPDKHIDTGAVRKHLF